MCRKSSSLRTGTFFEKTRVSLQKMLLLIYWWASQYPVVQAAREAGVPNTISVDFFQWLREIATYRLINHDSLSLGATGPIQTNVVQIDESCFSHKPKVNYMGLQDVICLFVLGALGYFFCLFILVVCFYSTHACVKG